MEKQKHQKNYITSQAENAMKENKKIKQSKKDQIKKILMDAGFDPKKHYTRKEKNKFTRIVKNKLFTKAVTPSFTEESIRKIIKEKNIAKKIRQDKLPYVPLFKPLPVVFGKQRNPSVAEINKKETPKDRKFKYVVQRRRSDDPMRCYDFLTDYFNAKTSEEAKKKASKIAKKYIKDTSFTGITVKDIEGTNDIIYYDGKALIAA